MIEFQRATKPLAGGLDYLIKEERLDIEPQVHRFLRDVHDHVLRVVERIESFRELLQNILSVNLSLVGLTQNKDVENPTRASMSQNEEVKKISGWAVFLFAPTLVGTIYGMNFGHMPELHWLFGYPFALSLMVMVSLMLYLVIKRRG